MPETPLPGLPEKYQLTPEFKLVTACSWIAPPALEQDQAEKIVSLCRGGIDWDAFVALVRRHGVPALAYTMLTRHAGDLLPGATREILKANHLQTIGQSMFQSTELVRLIKLFAQQGIDMLVMKGVLLSQQLYGNPTLRASTDIDLMVRLEDFDRADQLAQQAGYRCYSPGSSLTERQKSYHRTIGQNYEYTHENSGLKLEIHWRSYLWTQSQTDVLWVHRQPIAWLGETLDIWDDDALLLSLCYHGANHEWCSLKWLSDVAMLLSQDRPGGWESLLALADQLGMRRVLAQSALLVQWLYGVPLPDLLCRLIEDEKQTTPLCCTALRAMLMSSGELAAAGKRMDGLRHSWYLKHLIPSLSYTEILNNISINYADFKAFPLPDGLFWLYVPLRPLFWFWRNFILSEGRKSG